MKSKILGFFGRLRRLVFSLVSFSDLLSYLCAVLLRSDYYREVLSVMKGERAYLEGLRSRGYSLALLRRNTHRLEKGLIMRPRRAVFAEDYIMETVQAYSSAVKDGATDLSWSRDVLSAYFDAVERTAVLSKAYEVFKDYQNNPSDLRFVPKPRSDFVNSGVSYDSFMLLMKQRRSVRWYLRKRVPRELLDKAVAAANYSPTACNRQPFRFLIVDNPVRAAQIGSIPMGTSGFSDGFQVLVALVGNLDSFEFSRDRHLIYIDGSLAAMSFMLAVETLGLSSCPINWPDVPALEKIIAQELSLKSWERVIMFISVGYPMDVGGVPCSEKKEIAQIRQYEL